MCFYREQNINDFGVRILKLAEKDQSMRLTTLQEWRKNDLSRESSIKIVDIALPVTYCTTDSKGAKLGVDRGGNNDQYSKETQKANQTSNFWLKTHSDQAVETTCSRERCTNHQPLATMKGTKNNDDGYTSPYGDLQDSKMQNSTFSYESDSDKYGAKESRTRLIKKPSDKTEQQENESDLAMAVVDILSCCDGRINSNETKILKNMQSRLHDQGSLISGDDDEEKQETFSDEYPKRSLLRKISPTNWFFSSAKPSDNSTVRSSRSYIGPLQPGKDPVSQRKDLTRRKLIYAIGTVGAVLLLVGVIAVVKVSKTGPVKSDNEQKSRGYDTTHPNTDCSIVAEEEYADVLSQCACQGSITSISDSGKEKYEVLLQAFGAEYLHANETWHSCSARNQALVWLSEDRGSKLSDVLYQRHILVLFFIRLNGLGWSFQERQHKWLTPDHECTWFGVACNENKEVTAIELWNMNLDGSLPRELMSMTTLETLSLPENKIKGTLPTEAFMMMSKLTDLTLFMNSITGSIDGQIFKAATQLKMLNLDSNDLTGTLPSEIGELSNLEELKVRN